MGKCGIRILGLTTKKKYQFIMNRELDDQSLVGMDTDQNGKVSKEEYVKKCTLNLKKMDVGRGRVFLYQNDLKFQVGHEKR